MVLFENRGRNSLVSSTKYYLDEECMKLKRIVYEIDSARQETISISTYNEEGIEENLATEQKFVDGFKYYSNTTSVAITELITFAQNVIK